MSLLSLCSSCRSRYGGIRAVNGIDIEVNPAELALPDRLQRAGRPRRCAPSRPQCARPAGRIVY
jgi:hypothetical protein